MTRTQKFHVEITDTWGVGGTAQYKHLENYSFYTPADASRLTIVRRAKALAGWNGSRCVTRYCRPMGGVELRPAGIAQAMFIIYR